MIAIIYIIKNAIHFNFKKNSLNQRKIFSILVFFSTLLFSLIPMLSRANTCSTVSGTQLVFGYYDPLSEGPHDIATTIEFNCPAAFHGRAIIASLKFVDFSNDSSQRITNASGAGQLEVGFFSDPLRHQPIDGNTIIPIVDFNSQNQTFRITLYGRIAKKQKNVDVGNYFGKITLLLTYL